MKKLFTFLSVLLMVGCGPYSISVNENEIYTPPPLFTKFAMTDKHLKDCILQTIGDKGITDAKQLKLLSCSHAGIVSLNGIEIFDQIELLNLNDNVITDTKELSHLTKLQTLLLENNQLEEISALLTGPKLQKVNLKGNQKILCSDIKQLQTRNLQELHAPEKCRER